MKSIRDKKSWTDAYQAASDSFADMKVLMDFFQLGEGTEEDLDKHYKDTLRLVEDLEFRNMLSGEEDKFSVIVQINSGAGGTESQDWAQMLMRMYIRWGERNRYKVK